MFSVQITKCASEAQGKGGGTMEMQADLRGCSMASPGGATP